MQRRVGSRITIQKRLGVIGDIHTDVEGLTWAIATLQAEGVERILATGDLADGPGPGAAVTRCCEVLQSADALVVSSNHDRWLLEGEMRNLPDATFLEEVSKPAREFLRNLPATIEVETPLGLLLFGHGVGADDMATLYPHDHGPALQDNAALQAVLAEGRYRMLMGGHTHRRMVRVIEGLTVINAGALSRKREPCCLLLDFEAKEARFLDRGEGGTTKPGPRHPL
jgi:predicted phosphodiesterase